MGLVTALLKYCTGVHWFRVKAKVSRGPARPHVTGCGVMSPTSLRPRPFCSTSAGLLLIVRHPAWVPHTGLCLQTPPPHSCMAHPPHFLQVCSTAPPLRESAGFTHLVRSLPSTFMLIVFFAECYHLLTYWKFTSFVPFTTYCPPLPPGMQSPKGRELALLCSLLYPTRLATYTEGTG